MVQIRYLLDTNALLWWLTDHDKLSKKARQLVSNPNHILHVSAATGWELATKVRIGKLEEARSLVQDLSARLARECINVIGIEMRAAVLAGSMVHAHRDPFDRMIAAQATVENLSVISSDEIFDSLVGRRVW
jgi:PIN domain nuclease of toxin-antitoxin system